MSRTFKTSVLAVVFLLFLSLPSLAQTGRIVGTVTDETGAVVPGVTVTASSQATNLSRTFTTGDTGNYVFPGLAVATYIVRAELSGFNTAQTEALVEIDGVFRRDLRLTVGQLSNIARVLADAPLLQTDSSEVGQVVTNSQVVELPLNGRCYTALALLVPGVTTRGPGLRPGAPGLVSVNGSRGGRENNMVDGVTTNWSPERYARIILPSIESIQEFKLQTSTFNAEFGRGSAALNLTTKSGSNQYHGVVYHFWRNDSLAANDFFENQLPDPDSTGAFLNRNQFGATFGGPIIADKTFFFVNYEGERLREGRAEPYRVPTDLERAGDFSQSGVSFIRDPSSGENFPGKVVPQNRFHNVYNYFQGWWPRPNTPDGLLIAAPKTAADTDQFGIRIDHNLTQKDNVFFRYFVSRRDAANPGIGTEPFLMEDSRSLLDSRQYVAHWTHSFSPRLLLDFQYSRIEFDTLRLAGPNCFESDGCTNHVLASGIQNMDITARHYPGAPQFVFGGTWSVPSGFVDPTEGDFPTNSWKTNFTWIRGSHTVKGGIDFYRQNGRVRLGLQTRGNYSMNGAQTGTPWSDFMLGRAGRSTRAFPTTRVGSDDENYHYYIQDAWKIHSRLTVNIGLRYEYNLYPTPSDGGGAIDPATGNIIFADLDGDGSPHGEARNAPSFEHIFPLVEDALVSSTELGLAPSMTHTDKNNLAPRFGIA